MTVVDTKTVAHLIEPEDNLVTVDIKKRVPPHQNTVSYVHRSHLITSITKAIDKASINLYGYKCCWRGDISSFLFTKDCDHSSYYLIIHHVG